MPLGAIGDGSVRLVFNIRAIGDGSVRLVC